MSNENDFRGRTVASVFNESKAMEWLRTTEAANHLRANHSLPFDDDGAVILWDGERLETAAVLAVAKLRIVQRGPGGIRLGTA